MHASDSLLDRQEATVILAALITAVGVAGLLLYWPPYGFAAMVLSGLAVLLRMLRP